jgi:hypothetical protein
MKWAHARCSAKARAINPMFGLQLSRFLRVPMEVFGKFLEESEL